MTDETKAREGEVTQADRDTFFAIGEVEGWEIEDRSYDDDPTMQLLVRHRLAALVQPPPDVAQMQAEIERLRAEVALWTRRWEEWADAGARTLRDKNAVEAKLAEAVEALEQARNRLSHLERFRKGEANSLPAVDAAIELIDATLARIKETSRG